MIGEVSWDDRGQRGMRMLLGSESNQNDQNGAVKNQLMTLEGGKACWCDDKIPQSVDGLGD